MSERPFGRGLRLNIDAPGATGREIVGLRMTATVERGEGVKRAHSASLSVWNLSEAARSLLSRDGAVVEVFAGYGEDTGPLPRLLLGDVQRVESPRDGTDRITTVDLRDAGRVLSSTVVSISLARGRPRREAVAAIAVDLGLELVDDFGLSGESLQEGLAIVAPARDILSQLLADIGAGAVIADGRLRIFNPVTPQTGARVLVLTPDTTLIGSPSVGSEEDQSASQRVSKVTMTCLLAPLLRPGDIVSLESDLGSGFYRVLRLSLDIDSHGPTWYTSIEGQRV